MTSPATAGLTPENVVVVVNADSPASVTIAEEYVRLREISPGQVITLTGISHRERLSVDAFRAEILTPVLQAIADRKLSPQIRCVAYSADLPTAIDVASDAGPQKLPQILTPVASINGLTYLHRLTAAKDIRYLDLNSNLYARRVVSSPRDTPWQLAELRAYAAAMQQLQQAVARRKQLLQGNPPDSKDADDKNPDRKDSADKTKNDDQSRDNDDPPQEGNDKGQSDRGDRGDGDDGKSDGEGTPETAETTSPPAAPDPDKAIHTAIETLLMLKAKHPQSSELLYNLACGLTTGGRLDDAVAALQAAAAAGWTDHRHAANDPDLAHLRDRPDFQELLTSMKAATIEVQPARGFRADVGWLPNGEPDSGDQGMRYLLSTVLAVTSGRGTSVDEALAALRRSAQADGTRPSGTIYFMRNGDVRSTTREWAFTSAVAKLKSLGVAAVLKDGVLPQQKPDVAGAVIGIADFNWPASGSTILPGAIVEHLTSFGGVMTHGAGQTPLTEFLRQGAAGSSGTVTEPYAIQAKFPSPFLHVHYASGCTLAEAFYQSVTGPYQLLIVGDPLCAPWRKQMTLAVRGLPEAGDVSGSVTLSVAVDAIDGLKPVRHFVYLDGLLNTTMPANETCTVDTTQLSDGPHRLTVTSHANDLVETTGRWTQSINIKNSQN